VTDRDFTLGVILLDTRFPRHPGDVGNPASFPFAVRYRRVPAATVASVVRAEAPPPALAAALVEAGRALAAEGVDMVVTSCGFLAPLQAALAEALPVPVLSSALCLLPGLRRRHGPAARLGVLTFDSRRLGPAQLGGLDDGPLAVAGLERGRALYPAIAGDRATLDPAAAEADARAAARRLRSQAPGLAAAVLECTNLSPYRAAIAAELGCPVHDLVGAVLAAAAEPCVRRHGNEG
jgi:hypothetical protein